MSVYFQRAFMHQGVAVHMTGAAYSHRAARAWRGRRFVTYATRYAVDCRAITATAHHRLTLWGELPCRLYGSGKSTLA